MEVVTSYSQLRQLQEAKASLGVNSEGAVVKLNRWEAFCQKVGDLFRTSSTVAARAEALQQGIRALRMESRQAAATARPFAGPRDLASPPCFGQPAGISPRQSAFYRKSSVIAGMNAAADRAHPHAAPQQRKALAGAAQAWIMGQVSAHSLAKREEGPAALAEKLLALYEQKHPAMVARLLGTPPSGPPPARRTASPVPPEKLSPAPDSPGSTPEASRNQTAPSPQGLRSGPLLRPRPARPGGHPGAPLPLSKEHRDALIRHMEKRMADLSSGVGRMERQVQRDLHVSESRLRQETRELDAKLDALSDMMDDALDMGTEDMDEQVRAILREAGIGAPPSPPRAAMAPGKAGSDADAEYAALLREAEMELESEEGQALDSTYSHLSDSRLTANINRETRTIDAALSSTPGLLSDAALDRIDGSVKEIGKNTGALLQHSEERLRKAHAAFQETFAQVQETLDLLASPLPGDTDDAELEAELERIMKEQG